MKRNDSTFDWTLVQSFAAVVSEGSLSAAARKLGQSQPTIGRHIKSLEQVLGVDLFARAPRGLIPTAEGLAILDNARDMENAAARLRLVAEGRSEDLRGTVRITASVVVSYLLLPEIIAEIRQALPEIQIELVPSDTSENLIFREADIAIRMYRPTQLDVITRHVTDQPTALYASRRFLQRAGTPATMEEAMNMDFVGFDKSDLIIRLMRELGLDVNRDFFSVRCDDQAVYWQMVCEGCGIGAAQTVIGDAEPRVVRILDDQIPLPTLPVWLAAPDALRSNPRIRAVWDFLAEALAKRTGA